MIQDMPARKLNPYTQRSHISSCMRFAARLKRYHTQSRPGPVERGAVQLGTGRPLVADGEGCRSFFRIV